jgi:hypothetical protein
MAFTLTIVYALSILLNAAPSYSAYNVARDYSGSGFFSEWDFYGNYGRLQPKILWLNDSY